MAEPSTATEIVRVPILGENGRISDDYIPESIPQAVTAAEQAAESAASSANQALQQAAAAEKSASSATGSVEQVKTYANNASTYMTTAESHAESAASDANAAASSASAAAASAAAAEESNKSAAQSSADAMGFRNNAVQYRDQAREAAQEAEGYVTTVQQLSQNATNSATAAQNSATSASASAEIAATAETNASASATNAAASAQTASEKAASVLDHYIESATATTLEAGQPATATVVDKVLQLGIPKGDKGDPGDVSAVTAADGSDLSVSTDEGTVTIDDSALRARIEELENASRNVVTGTSTDLVAHGEDAYAQKPIEVRVKGKTWVNRWPKINKTSNGITASTDETGLITVTGEASGASGYLQADALGLVVSKKVTIAISNSIGGNTGITQVFLQFKGSDGSQLEGGWVSISSGNTVTTTVPSGTVTVICGFETVRTGTVNWSGRVMLVDGTEAPDCFTPPASISSVQTGNLVTSGKNLLQRLGDSLPFTTGGITYSDNGDSGIRITGTATDSSYYNFWNSRSNRVQKLPAGNYAVSLIGQVDNTGFSCGYFVDDYAGPYVSWISTNQVDSNNGTITTEKYIRPYLFVVAGTTVDTVVYPQLELGSTATAYEPLTVTTTTLPEVELRSLPNGTCDELVIRADGTCDVERRTGYIASYTDEEVTGEYVSTGDGLEAEASIVYELDGATTEPQSPVTLPALPAPTFNQYHDADVPSDTSTQYARDINIVLSNLEAVQAALLGGE